MKITNHSTIHFFSLSCSYHLRPKWRDGSSNWTLCPHRCHDRKVASSPVIHVPSAKPKINSVAKRTTFAMNICWLKAPPIYGANWASRNGENYWDCVWAKSQLSNEQRGSIDVVKKQRRTKFMNEQNGRYRHSFPTPYYGRSKTWTYNNIHIYTVDVIDTHNGRSKTFKRNEIF